jgi:P27 family predicted phage terminase small subunit
VARAAAIIEDPMPGPRPQPVRLKLLRGNPGRRAIRGTFDPPAPPEPPEPPPFLTGYALAEWHRVGPGLTLFGLLTPLDVAPLAAYCVSFAHWRQAEELLQQLAAVDEKARGLLIKGSKGQARSNPLVQIAREAAADMIRAACEFGFSPAARSRIALGVGGPFARPPASKFDGLLAGTD